MAKFEVVSDFKDKDVTLPKRSTGYSAGYDFYAVEDEVLPPNMTEPIIVPTGIKVELGTGISGKMGILRRANMSKTANFSSRLVISAPELKVETPEEMMVDFDKSAIPLSAAIAEFRDFIMFHVRQFFEHEFLGSETYPVIDKNGKEKYVTLDNPLIAFSDERIKHEMERYLHGYNNRFVPVEIPIEGTNEKYYMQFKGQGSTKPSDNPESIYHRRMTWCDIFFIGAIEATKNKSILITRFPIFHKKTVIV